MNNETAGLELTAQELDLVSGGDINLGPFRFYYSEGARAFGVSIGGFEVYVGANSAGWCYGDQYGQIRY